MGSLPALSGKHDVRSLSLVISEACVNPHTFVLGLTCRIHFGARSHGCGRLQYFGYSARLVIGGFTQVRHRCLPLE